jgi:hypothetical protein
MGQTTFSGPVVSLNGFVDRGPNFVVNITANTELTVADHAGKILRVNDADCKITLPTINDSSVSGPDTPSNIGSKFTFYIETDSTDLDILTDGTDKFVGSLSVAGTTQNAFAPAASNDVATFNGTTTGGDKGSYIEVTAIDDNVYLIQGVLVGSGTVATPFADS